MLQSKCHLSSHSCRRQLEEMWLVLGRGPMALEETVAPRSTSCLRQRKAGHGVCGLTARWAGLVDDMRVAAAAELYATEQLPPQEPQLQEAA